MNESNNKEWKRKRRSMKNDREREEQWGKIKMKDERRGEKKRGEERRKERKN